MEFLIALIVTVVVVAIIVAAAIAIYRWMEIPDPWSWIVRAVMGLIALVVLVGFVTGRIPLIRIPGL